MREFWTFILNQKKVLKRGRNKLQNCWWIVSEESLNPSETVIKPISLLDASHSLSKISALKLDLHFENTKKKNLRTFKRFLFRVIKCHAVKSTVNKSSKKMSSMCSDFILRPKSFHVLNVIHSFSTLFLSFVDKLTLYEEW